jgi:acetate---CoA ligase (ADP-forming)
MKENIAALMAPRNIVLVGASDHNWSPRIWQNLIRFGFEGRVFPVNPNRHEIWGTRCYPSLADLPETPDHMALLVPHEQTIAELEAGGKLGARSASIYAAGFGEGGDAAGRDRAQRLRQYLRSSGIAAVGPNCMGLAVGRAKFCTFPGEWIEPLAPGPVAVLAQSGALAQMWSRGLSNAGLTLAYLISCGNQIGLTFADYIDYLADDPDLRVITCYIESVLDAPRFLAAADKASRNGKSLVVVKAGGSEAARGAALAHTGSLAGSIDVFDAFARDVGIVRVDLLEDVVEAAAYFARAKRPCGRGVGVMTYSGAVKSLVMEAAGHFGLQLAPLVPETSARLREALAGSDAANPLDTKNPLRTEEYMVCVQALHNDPNVDLLLLADELPREAGVERRVRNLTALDEWIRDRAEKPVVLFSPFTLHMTRYMRDLRARFAHVPMLNDLGKTLRTIAKIAAARLTPVVATCEIPDARRALVAHWRTRAMALHGPTALNEVQSKELLAAYGISLPPEETVGTVEDAAATATRIGFPVVLKAVCASVPHKSDAGLVFLNLQDGDAVRSAATRIVERCAALGAPLEGILVAKQISGGTEMVLGIHRDPEMGPVVMVGMGGIWLELFKDVVFAPPGLGEERAHQTIAATRAATVLAGFRGAPERDVDALARAMVAIGHLACALSDVIEAVDVNPLLVLSCNEGAVALDGLVVLRPPATRAVP